MGKVVRNKHVSYDSKILKGLLFGSFRSKQKLAEAIGVPYIQVQRRVPTLRDKKYIYLVEKPKRKDGKRDKRNPERLGITWKGLVFLAVKAKLTENEIGKALPDISALLKSRVVDTEERFFVRAFSKVFEKMRNRVNLENFDENYVRDLFGNLMMKELMEYFSSLGKKATKKDKSRIMKMVKKVRMKPHLLEFFKVNLSNFKKSKRKIEDNIKLIEGVVEFLQTEVPG